MGFVKVGKVGEVPPGAAKALTASVSATEMRNL